MSASVSCENRTLRLAGVIKESIVDGPGLRFTVFVQGCPHHCPGCHNPQTHDFEGGFDCPIDKIVAEVKKNPLLQGVTLSGGEPFCQCEALAALCREVKALGLNIYIYSGYTFEQILQLSDPFARDLLEQCDILMDGPFLQEERTLDAPFRGSRNQRAIEVAPSLTQGEIVLHNF
ncbi:anaerobic ribonucleoside-triphosphate reductase activating protein [Zongyangia hominis]|uniref:Anaerobic ribonucleoside-triphosphate reductase-activating protein n=1 Tax=Zongyangia hominis TaxID=2763677 RepID=A0A926IAJ6_9FIRM|nr:anaerobic ribonucleoside-triphosphate reductase activating protein [Zongyangia hominis]MBC8570286.1 anaerobic ribonucleoside-triphosphate reductase activating protein [Zongyangia hominis]